MNHVVSDLVTIDIQDAEALWETFARSGTDDILAREAFERELRFAAGLEDEGLYFRPGGWTIDLPVTAARIAVVAAVLAAGFQIAGLEDLDREVIIASAGLVAAMDLRPVRLGGQDRHLAERLRQEGLTGKPITAAQARRALPKQRRRDVSKTEIASALDRLVAAGLADREGDGEWVVRAHGHEAWFRLRFPSD
jgi:hypothetical protein